MADYLRDGNAIYERSFAIIRAEADLSRFSAEEADVAVRMIHACGSRRGGASTSCSRRASSPRRARRCARGAPILCDAEMVAHGVTRARLPASNEVICTLRDPRVPRARQRSSATRARPPRSSCGATGSAARWSPSAMRRPRCSVCSKCSTTARRSPPPSSACRSASSARPNRRRRSPPIRCGVPLLIVRGRMGGSAMTAAAVNALARAGTMSNGPSDRRRHRPGRSRAADAEGRARARRGRRGRHFAKRGNAGNARAIVAPHLRDGVEELPLLYPVTTEIPKDGAAYRDAHRATSTTTPPRTRRARISTPAAPSRCSAEGDPLFYGSYMHLHVRLADRYPTEVIAGVTGMSGCWSPAGAPIAQGDDVLTVLPGTLPEAELDAAARRHRRRGDHEGRPQSAQGPPRARRDRAARPRDLCRARHHGERRDRCGWPTSPTTTAPYFSIVLVPGWAARP